MTVNALDMMENAIRAAVLSHPNDPGAAGALAAYLSGPQPFDGPRGADLAALLLMTLARYDANDEQLETPLWAAKERLRRWLIDNRALNEDFDA